MSTPSAPVIVTRDGAVATITLNRPEAMNALDHAAKEALRTALQEAGADESVRCVVLTGTGRAFCAGQDLAEHAAALEDERLDLGVSVREEYSPLVELLVTLDKPVIAAVNGVAAGAGAGLAFAADLRLLADTASFALAFTGIGLACDTGTSWTLPRLVGLARAKELLLSPSPLRADDALRLGLATEVVPAAELAARAAERAAELAAGPTRAYGAIRRALASASGQDLATALEGEARAMSATGSTADHRAAVTSFLAKERPRFTGR